MFTHRQTRLLGASALSIAAALLTPQAIMAAGTTAGTTITNTATINFQVGGVDQTQIQDSDTITVDRKINLTVSEADTATMVVVPGQTDVVVTYTVTNTSNQVLDFALSATQQSGGTAAHGSADSFDVTGLALYLDTNANGTYEAGTDTAVTYLDELAEDATATVFAVGTVPLNGLSTGSVAGINLTATGREGGTAAAQGSALVQTTGANTAGVDTVFADSAGVSDGARDAAHSAGDDYSVVTATLTVDKTSIIVSDPVNGTTNPKLIPGATVQYCIAVSNASGGAGATSVALSDPLPAQVTFVPGSILLNGTVSSGACLSDGTTGGSFSAGTVSGTLASVPAGQTRTIVFLATVN